MKKLPDTIRKILIIRMSSLGDIILTSPVIRRLRQQFPAARIDFLVREEYADLVRYNPHLSNIIELNVRHGRPAVKSLRDKIRLANYDVILDLHRNLRSAFLRRFPAHSPVLKIKKNLLLRFLLVKFKINLYRKFYGHPLSVAEKYLRTAAPLGLPDDDLRLEMHLPPEAVSKGVEIWSGLQKENYRVVMAPGARHFTKRWPPDYYAELIRLIYREKGWRTLLVGGADEKAAIEEIQVLAGDEIQRSLAGEISLLETVAIIREAPLFISNDSGLMHAAAAFQKPQIALFGSTVEELGFFPLNPHAKVLENATLPCRPCSHIGRSECPQKHFKCMLEVQPEAVLDNLLHLMQDQ